MHIHNSVQIKHNLCYVGQGRKVCDVEPKCTLLEIFKIHANALPVHITQKNNHCTFRETENL